jgi:N-acetyl-gamma-glutamyl-phosphate reductase
MSSKPAVFIDGESGTTGLQIYSRLSPRSDLELVSIDAAKRKDPRERAKLIDTVDLAILCLPDAAAQEVIPLITNPQVKILDASTAHRTAPGWVYGFPELAPDQRQAIATAPRVSNPGCYPTGFLAAIRPLITTGLIPATFPITLNAISGYSGGGKQMIQAYQDSQVPGQAAPYPYGIYGLGFGHKHVKEMYQHSGLHNPPLFVPAVGDFIQGMLVQVPLPLWSLGSPPSGQQIHRTLQDYYQGESFVVVHPLGGGPDLRHGKFLDVLPCNHTNRVDLFVFANDQTQEALVAARLDNLGKGASGAAVQNLNLMLGFAEDTSLTTTAPPLASPPGET